MRTQKRIEKLSEMVKLASSEFNRKITVIDVGTDHGYLAERLSKFDFVSQVIATDISEKSLQKLKNLIKIHNILKINCVFCDGITKVDSGDVTVIAGIGGEEIIRILKTQNKKQNGENKCNLFVLCPAQNVVELRKYIFENKIKLVRDECIEDVGRFYQILLIDLRESQENEKNEFNLYLGRDNTMENSDFVKMVRLADEFLKFLENITDEQIERDKALQEKVELKNIIKKLLEEKLC